MQPDQEVIKRWSGSAPFWEKHSDIIGQMFAPITQALVEDGQIGTQHTVMDVATGPGEPALSVAALVGPEGKIFGIDPIPEMIAGARRAASRLGLKNVQFDVASADRLPFPADTFDAVISRFGVMFFPSPNRRGSRDAESAQARTETGFGGLAFRHGTTALHCHSPKLWPAVKSIT
jgi:ubiquinone/menaquinone biosynthesis C-methylase UbiE